jgi:hypothetical protein
MPTEEVCYFDNNEDALFLQNLFFCSYVVNICFSFHLFCYIIVKLADKIVNVWSIYGSQDIFLQLGGQSYLSSKVFCPVLSDFQVIFCGNHLLSNLLRSFLLLLLKMKFS